MKKMSKYLKTHFIVISTKSLEASTREKIESAIIDVLKSEAKQGKLGKDPLIAVETQISEDLGIKVGE